MKYFIYGLLAVALVAGCTQAFASTYYSPADKQPAALTTEAIHTAKNLAASINGHAARIADTGSMAPALTSNDIIVYKPATTKDINKGDIVVVESFMDGNDMGPRSLFTHRVINKSCGFGSCEFWTKGDHNKDIDNWKSGDDNLKGIVVYIINGQTGEVRSVK